MTENEVILKHLKTNRKGITSKEAFEKYGITRLSARIFDLRKRYAIETITEQGVNRFGNLTQYARYVLIKEEK